MTNVRQCVMLSTTSVVNTYGGSRRLAQWERCFGGWGCVRLGLFCRQRCPPEGIVGATRQRREARAVDSCGRFPAAADGFPGQRAPPAESVNAFPAAVLLLPTVTNRQPQGRAGCCGTPGRLRNPPPCQGRRRRGIKASGRHTMPPYGQCQGFLGPRLWTTRGWSRPALPGPAEVDRPSGPAHP